MKTLITGSTGHLGSATIAYLLNKVSVNKIAALARNIEKSEIILEQKIS